MAQALANYTNSDHPEFDPKFTRAIFKKLTKVIKKFAETNES